MTKPLYKMNDLSLSGVDVDNIAEELTQVRKSCQKSVSDSKLVTCTRDVVRVEIEKSKVKSLVVLLRFPMHYPVFQQILVELKSKTLDEKLLQGLTKACEEEAKKYPGEPQVMRVVRFVSKFMDDNPLICCSGEISHIKRELLKPEDVIKLKQKSATIVLNLQEKGYYYNCDISIPNDYPESRLQIDTTGTNFPESFSKLFLLHAKEIARKCVEPPLGGKETGWAKPAGQFHPQPSLLPVVKFLVNHVHDYPTADCRICHERCLPENPEDAMQSEYNKKHDNRVERILCGHLYHLKCLLKYLKTPPFAGGKKCLVCQELVFHHEYKVPPELAEARWAHHQARQREIADVVDFLK